MKNDNLQKGVAIPVIIVIVMVAMAVLGGFIVYVNKSNEAKKMAEEKSLTEKKMMEEKQKDLMMKEKGEEIMEEKGGDNMESEKQPQELIRLIDKLVGTWGVELTIKLSDGSILKGKGRLEAKEIVNGFGVRTEMDLDVEGLGKYVEQDLWGYQRWERKVHLYSITTTAAVHDHTGSWKDDNTLVFHWEGLNEGKPSTEELTLKWISSDKITAHEIDTADGKVEMELDYTLARK